MLKRIVLCAIACIVLSFTLASAAGNGPSVWNQLAASYNFYTYPAPAGATFGDVYYGDNFEADFSNILREAATLMGGKIGTNYEDDTINARLEDWGL